jgi:dihydrofolate synthase/folylpolyglutamate synthase
LSGVDADKEAMAWLASLQSRGWRTSLDEMRTAMQKLGNPELGLTAIHVAGTNGKGSVCAMAASILKEAGKKVGLYTSPHLMDIKERIVVDGRQIDERRLAELTRRMRGILEESGPATELSFFEFVTAIAFIHFAEEKVDVAVLETGFGGRLDATNVLPSSMAAITQIGLDHTEYLGKTVEEIAGEKAGIIKKCCGVVSSTSDASAARVIRERAGELGCSLMEQGKDFHATNVRADLSGTSFDYEGARVLRELKTDLLGRHQAENAATAISACDMLAKWKGFDIEDNDIRRGLAGVAWPGRLEIVSRKPLMILDCAHNPSAIGRAMSSISDLGVTPDTIIFAASRDKDFRMNASILFPKAKRLVLTRYGSQRSIEQEILAELPEASDKTIFITEDVPEAIEVAREVTSADEAILIIGSVFLVGDALSWLRHGKKVDLSMAGF